MIYRALKLLVLVRLDWSCVFIAFFFLYKSNIFILPKCNCNLLVFSMNVAKHRIYKTQFFQRMKVNYSLCKSAF